MSADDVWGAAQNVIMWLTTAQQSLEGATNRTIGGFFANLLTRGHASRAGAREAADAIGKAKVAFVDLANALNQAQMAQVKLATLEHPQIERAQAKTVRDMIARDLATLEKLVADVEARQRAAR
jgi:hypothetical protein